MGQDSLQNKVVHSLFEITIFFKGLNGIWEIIVGVLFLIFKREAIRNTIIALTHREIVQDSGHLAMKYLTNQANNFSSSTQYFIAVYFLFYGLVNIFLVVSLLKGKSWAYPVAIVFFSLFILYQLYRSFAHHSGLLLALTIFDIFLVGLTFLEYKRVQKGRKSIVE